jgi:hypothetical protein
MIKKAVWAAGALIAFVLILVAMIPRHVAADQKTLEQRVTDLEKNLADVKMQATRAQDVLDIENLQARYEAIHSSQENLTWMLFANRPDDTYEITHSHVIGYENIKLYLTDHEKLMELYRAGKLPAGTHLMDWMASIKAGGGPTSNNANKKVWGEGRADLPPIHPIETPNIIVAEDGKTAKATFVSLGFEAGGWCYGKYANDYIKVDGKWYLWHEKWLRGFRTSSLSQSPQDQTIDQIFEFTKDRDANGFPVVPKELSAQYLWYPGKESMTITAPRPYQTWTKEDDNGAWWKKPTVEP